MGGDAFEDAGKSPGFDRMMIGNDLVVFSIHLRGHADVGAFLSVNRITQDAQGFDQLRPVDIPGDFHRARTSSRTK